ncbi:hypothetical protein OIO90_003841 [Microbotryomycetes sp. JL221]|nr:hypothetical protein OIO90_003841 [Microbotryomycetes sp. JL221]
MADKIHKRLFLEPAPVGDEIDQQNTAKFNVVPNFAPDVGFRPKSATDNELHERKDPKLASKERADEERYIRDKEKAQAQQLLNELRSQHSSSSTTGSGQTTGTSQQTQQQREPQTEAK